MISRSPRARLGLVWATALLLGAPAAAEEPVKPEKPAVSGPAAVASLARERRARTRAAKDAMEGRAPPPFHVESWRNTDGEPLDWKALRGKVVLIDFWGTWCPPCRKSIPKLRQLYRERREDGLVVIGVHTTNGADQVATFVEEQGIEYPIATDVDQRTVRAWGVDGYPDYYLIGRDGKVLVADLANRELERAIVLLLGEKAAATDATTAEESDGSSGPSDVGGAPGRGRPREGSGAPREGPGTPR